MVTDHTPHSTLDAPRSTPTVLITGCSSGIGRATAQRLAAHGWRVYASARRLESVADLASDTITPLSLDVTDEAACRQAVDRVLQQAGRVDALVNNAGYGHTGPLEEISPQDVRTQFEVNTFAPLRLAQSVVPAMRTQGGGRIVNVSSVMGRVAIPFQGLYNASKFALEAMSDALRMELAPWNIRVILVEPGSVRTPFYTRVSGYMARTLENPDSPYRGRVERVQRLTGGRGLFSGSPPGQVAKVIHAALVARRPRARYVATWDGYLALTMLLLPDGLRDWLFKAGFGL